MRQRAGVFVAVAVGLLFGLGSRALAGPPWYDPWVAARALDQRTAVTTFNSFLVSQAGANVRDVDLLGAAVTVDRPGFPAGVKLRFLWAFSQCFGAGFFDELNLLVNPVQSGSSASRFLEPSIAPLAPAAGVGSYWALEYVNVLNLGSNAINSAAVAASNDAWGPDPRAIRAGEVVATEHPVYFTTGNAPPARSADNMRITKTWLTLIWAGKPEKWDRDRTVQAITGLKTKYKLATSQIVVLYGNGSLPNNPPLNVHPIITALGRASRSARQTSPT